MSTESPRPNPPLKLLLGLVVCDGAGIGLVGAAMYLRFGMPAAAWSPLALSLVLLGAAFFAAGMVFALSLARHRSSSSTPPRT
jgi:drug/metabolite transporter (DMT)-like permease